MSVFVQGLDLPVSRPRSPLLQFKLFLSSTFPNDFFLWFARFDGSTRVNVFHAVLDSNDLKDVRSHLRSKLISRIPVKMLNDGGFEDNCVLGSVSRLLFIALNSPAFYNLDSLFRLASSVGRHHSKFLAFTLPRCQREGRPLTNLFRSTRSTNHEPGFERSYELLGVNVWRKTFL